MATIRIAAEKPSDFRITARADQVSRFTKTGDDLVVHLVDGKQIVIGDFFVKGPNGEVSRLLYEDGSYSGVDGNAQTVEGEAAGIGTGLANEEMIAMGVAG
ncbi:BapA prefix-like domain-containing protein, partial [Pseudogemmobacter humi]|uniref:BapA prefix-like domain-containing protein n=1 Tax=Pseudogemmobacter humi TaxID=2483812 RepID=UPI000F51CB10